MSKVKIITDSCCDIPKNLQEEFNIDVIPFEITLGEQSFWEGVDITNEEFYELLSSSQELPKTSQITAMRFEEKFMEYVDAEYTDLIVELINSTGSQTFSNAVLAKNNLEKKGKLGNTTIHLIDSHGYSISYGYPLIEAAKKLQTGKSVASIVAYLEDFSRCFEIYIIGFDLRHMKKSGRISAASAFLGELMSLKPIISLIDGVSTVVAKARGEKNAIADAVEYITGRMVPETDWTVLRTTTTENEDNFIKLFTKKVGYPPALISYAGAAVSSNAGPQMIGVVIRSQKRQ